MSKVPSYVCLLISSNITLLFFSDTDAVELYSSNYFYTSSGSYKLFINLDL